MGGLFGVALDRDCTMDLFFGVDYHSHLGTYRGGMALYNGEYINRKIHSIENAQFRSKFDKEIDSLEGKYVDILLYLSFIHSFSLS